MTRVDCSEVRRLVQLRLDDDLPEAEWHRLTRHIDNCGHCQQIDAELDAIDSALRESLSAPQAPPESLDETARSVRRARVIRRRLTTWLPAAAAFVLVAAGLFAFMRGGRPPLAVGPAMLISGGEAVHVFEPNQRVAQPGRTGVYLQERAVAWGMSKEPIVLEFAGGAQMVLSQEAVVRIGSNGIDLIQGNIRADLRDSQEGFTIATPWGEFEAVDAIFVVYSDATGARVRVEVFSGDVRVEHGSSIRTIGAGQQLTLQPDPDRKITL